MLTKLVNIYDPLKKNWTKPQEDYCYGERMFKSDLEDVLVIPRYPPPRSLTRTRLFLTHRGKTGRRQVLQRWTKRISRRRRRNRRVILQPRLLRRNRMLNKHTSEACHTWRRILAALKLTQKKMAIPMKQTKRPVPENPKLQRKGEWRLLIDPNLVADLDRNKPTTRPQDKQRHLKAWVMTWMI